MRRMRLLVLILLAACVRPDFESRVMERFDRLSFTGSSFRREGEKPKGASDFYFLGIAFFKNGKTKKAMMSFQRAYKLQPQKAEYACAIAQLYYFLAIFDMVERDLFKVGNIRLDTASTRSFLNGFLGFETEAVELIYKNTLLKKPALARIVKETFPYYKKIQQGRSVYRFTVPRARFFPDKKSSLLLRDAFCCFECASELSGEKNSILTGLPLDLNNIKPHIELLIGWAGE